ncbi:MAG TPA: two-component system response regulator NarL [Moraxellaceae bacterium]|nr:two-component system response regulator NarL [Moraxellaceae bacterium]
MSDTPPYSILLVDDHPMIRRGLRQLLEMERDFQVVGEANGGAEALAHVSEVPPDFVILDNKMAAMSGLETLRKLREAGYEGKVLLYTVSDSEDDVRDAMRHGADGYLLKDMDPRELMSDIHKALEGEVVISERLANYLNQSLAASSVADEIGLTTREKEVLRMLASGSSNRVIGEQLGIAEGTVKVHVKNLFSKLGIHTRVEAVVWAMEKLNV